MTAPSLSIQAAKHARVRARKLVRERIGTFRVLFLIHLLQWPVRVVTSQIARRWSRDPNLIAFGASGQRFADNTAYLFLHMSATTAFRCVWVSGSREVADGLKRCGESPRPNDGHWQDWVSPYVLPGMSSAQAEATSTAGSATARQHSTSGTASVSSKSSETSAPEHPSTRYITRRREVGRRACSPIPSIPRTGSSPPRRP